MSGDTARSGDELSAGTVPVTGEEAFDRLLTTEDRVLVGFHADWCDPCQRMAPRVARLAGEVDAAVATVDVESLPQVADRYDVRSIPTFVAFEEGEVRDRLVGVQDTAALAAILE